MSSTCPLLLTDPYGHFKPGPHGFPQLVLPNSALLEGNPAANGGAGVLVPANAFRTGHAFLNDIAHNAVPSPGLVPDADTTICDFRTCTQPAGTYDDELLDRALRHRGRPRQREHRADDDSPDLPCRAQPAGGLHRSTDQLAVDAGRNRGVARGGRASGWDYGERLFQAARFGTEMQYQHLVFEEFARKMQPLINPFLGGITSINRAISAEFAHTVYRLGHSMLPERVSRRERGRVEQRHQAVQRVPQPGRVQRRRTSRAVDRGQGGGQRSFAACRCKSGTSSTSS